MSFRDSFERHVNEEMSGNPSASRPSLKIRTDTATDGLKKRHSSLRTPDLEADHHEYDEKHDRPPRFSTLFGVTPPLPPRTDSRSPVIVSRRQKGIVVPVPVFILLVGLIICEGLALFAYTAIGLYSSVSSRLIHPAQDLCANHDQAGVNISPNIIIGAPVPSNMNVPAPALAAAVQPALTSIITTAPSSPLSSLSSSTSTVLSQSSSSTSTSTTLSSSITNTASNTTTPMTTTTTDAAAATSLALNNLLKIFVDPSASESGKAGVVTVQSTVSLWAAVTVDPPPKSQQSEQSHERPTVTVWVRSVSADTTPTATAKRGIEYIKRPLAPRETVKPEY